MIVVQQHHPVRDQIPRRVIPARDHHETEAEDVPVGQALAVDLRGDQRAEQVVGRLGGAGP